MYDSCLGQGQTNHSEHCLSQDIYFFGGVQLFFYPILT